MMMKEMENLQKELDNKKQKPIEISKDKDRHVGEWLSCDYDTGWPLKRLNVPVMTQEARKISENSDDMSPEQDFDHPSPLSRPGWPLLRIAAAASEATMSPLRESRTGEKLSVVQWVMDLPIRSFSLHPPQQASSNLLVMEDAAENCLTVAPRRLSSELEFLIGRNPADCRLFSYAEIERATSHFSTDNLIGEGGCSSVYRGCFGEGEWVAVKILKSYKEAWDDFFLEAKFVSSIQHKHITSLVGLCVEDGRLILVYELFPIGSLEANLHGGSKLPWEVRFNVAVAVAEALNYLHNDCPQPLIHRDVKSSNILLSDELQPQLSDFGMAIRGSTDSAYLISDDVVGTFGYIAPEYFMHGMVSDKIDVYAFGVVLLELVSGRKPVDVRAPKGQESLVKWAIHLLEIGDFKALLDPNLGGDYDPDQMRRTIMAAGLCINQSPQIRPKISQVLNLLTGEIDANECFNSHVMDSRESAGHQTSDDPFPEVHCRSPSVSVLSDMTDGSITSSSSTDTASSIENQKHRRRHKLKDYLTLSDHFSFE